MEEAIRNQDASRPLCRFFALQGRSGCRFGENCTFSHTLPEGGVAEARKLVPCPYFLKGNCRYGEFCQLRHDEKDLVERRDRQEGASAAPLTCGICLEDVVKSGKRFGLLSCPHCFCFDCLRQWRKSKSCDVDATRSCPTCRKKSDYVVPSKKFCLGEEKDRVVAAYKDNLSTVPCRKFDGTLGSCPFGRDCFFAHRGPDGDDMKPLDKSMKERRKGRDGRNRHASDIDMINSFLFLLTLRGIEFFDDSDYDSAWSSDEEDVD